MAVVFALVPAFAASRIDLADVLRELGGAAPTGRRRAARGGLVAVQVALATVLLIGAGLTLRSLRNAARVEPGFEPAGLIVASLSPGLPGYGPSELGPYFDRLLAGVSALPGVERAALASHLPLTFAINFLAVNREGDDGADSATWPVVDAAAVGAGYFETLRIPLVLGRSFGEHDIPGTPGVVLVNETLARSLWPGEPAVGHRVRVAGVEGPLEVVGVVRDGKYRTLGERPRPFLYLCLGQAPRGTETLIVRAEGDLRPLLPAVLDAARGLDPRVPVGRPTSVDEALAGVLLLPRAAATLLGSFGLVALLLAAVGIYGVVAFLAAGRTREIGLRLALGAGRGQIVRWLLRRGLTSVAVGLAAGLGAAASCSWALAGILYDIPPLDPLTFFGVAVVLALVAIGAAGLPARRAARLEPAAALRQE